MIPPSLQTPLPASGPRRQETILFADDEAILRTFARAVLEGEGYKVLLAEDGLQAVETYTRERGRIDLVILDLMMPRLSGRDAFRRLLDIDPRARVMFASGYTPETLSPAEQACIQGFVAKPYHPDDLARIVRCVLDRFRQTADPEERGGCSKDALKEQHAVR